MSLAEVQDYDQPRSTPDRTPPQDVVAEQCVLGSMLMSKDAIADVVEVIRGTDFYRPAHELIYDAVLDLYGRGEPADAITVADELTKRGEIGRVGGHPYLHDLLATVPVAANAGYYAEIVREKAILRRLVDASVKIAQLGYGAQGDVDEIVDAAQAEVYSVTDRRASEDYQPLSALMESTLDEIEAIEGNGGVMAGVPTGFAELDELTNGLHGGQMVIVAARPAMGKALALETVLPTPDGWTTMGLVDEGDVLLDGRGQPTTVVATTEVMLDRPCFEITFADGTSVVADAEHQWQAVDRSIRPTLDRGALDRLAQVALAAQDEPDCGIDEAGLADELGTSLAPLRAEVLDVLTRRAAGSRGTAGVTTLTWSRREALLVATLVAHRPRRHGEVRATVTTAEMAADLQRAGGSNRWAVPLGEPLVGGPAGEGEDRELALPPYALGAWLGGDGRMDGWFIPPTDEVAALVVADGVNVTPDGGGFVMAGATDPLRQLDVGRHRRRLPMQYLRASRGQRRALLAGLVDTAGTVLSSGEVRVAASDYAFARQIYELVTGLGHRADLVEFSDGDWWVCFVTAEDVFRTAAGKARHQEFRPPADAILPWRAVVSVEPVPSVPVRCVEVDNPERMYLATRAMIPTHNSTLGLDLARAASIKNGLCSAIFSLEMSQTEITMRLLSAEADIPLNHIRKGQMTEEDWTRLSRKMGEVSEAPLFIDDSPNLTMMEIRAKARRLKQRHDLRLVVIDYMQLMTSGKKVESRQLEVSEFSRQIKLLAKELNIPVVAISQLNRGPEQRTDKKPMVADLRESGCLTADTRVLRADTGTEIELGELLSSGERMIPVWSTDEQGRMVARTMTHAFPSGRKETFAMTLASGRVIRATANHPFRTLDGWTALGDLGPGSRIAVPRMVPEPLQPVAWDRDELVLLAHMIGDGSCLPRQPLRYASVDEANLTAVADAARRRFGITAKRDEYAAARVTTLRLPAPFRCTHGRRNPMNAWLDDHGLFGRRSHDKFIPDRVFSASRADVAFFLRHLWATDGSIRWDPTAGQGRIYYASTSRRLADDVARLLLRFGIVARIKTARKAGYRDGYHVVINGVTDQLTFCTEIGCHGERGDRVAQLREYLKVVKANTNLDTIPREVWGRVRARLAERGITHREFAAAMEIQFCGSTLWKHAPSRGRLARVAEAVSDPELAQLAATDLYWDSVVSIESIGVQDVYDATVLGTHNFVADGIVVHNSLEQDADMIILLHREDYYDRESPRLGEADFIVAKHRNGPTRDIPVVFQGHYSRFRDMQH